MRKPEAVVGGNMNNFWMYVSLIGIFLSQILIGMYISVIIYERMFKNGDSKHILPADTDSGDSSLVEFHSNKVSH